MQQEWQRKWKHGTGAEERTYRIWCKTVNYRTISSTTLSMCSLRRKPPCCSWIPKYRNWGNIALNNLSGLRVCGTTKILGRFHRESLRDDEIWHCECQSASKVCVLRIILGNKSNLATYLSFRKSSKKQPKKKGREIGRAAPASGN